MASSIFTDDFYKKLKNICEKIENSDTKFIVSSIGKQSLGKSYFLNKIFDSNFESKDGKLVGRGTECIEWERLSGFNMFDMEGMDSTESVTIRDTFNFFSIMTISDVILFHIMHRDLEDRDFIQNFAFLILQCFSPLRSTCHSFRLHMPKIILLIKDPRWEDEDPEVLNNYKKLVESFQSQVIEQYFIYSNHLISILEAAEVDHEKDKKKKEEIKEEFKKIRNLPIDFKIDEHYPVYYEQIGFGRQKTIQYYKIREKNGIVMIKPSSFKFLMHSIQLEMDKKARMELNDSPLSLEHFNEFQNIQGFDRIFDVIKKQKKYEEGLVSIISQIYIDVKNDIFFSFENIDEIERFFSKYYKIKDGLEAIVKTATKKKKIIKPKIDNKIIQINIKNQIEEIKQQTFEAFCKIIRENNLSNIAPKIIDYFRLILMKRFNEIFNLHPDNKDSILYTTLLVILCYKDKQDLNKSKKKRDDKDIITKHLKYVENQIIIFKCLWLFDDPFKELLKSSFSKNFKFVQVIISLFHENLNLIRDTQSEIKLEKDALQSVRIDPLSNYNNVEKFLSIFLEFSSIKEETFTCFYIEISQIYEIKLEIIINDEKLQKLEKCKKIDVIVIDRVIKNKSLIHTFLPVISGLMTGIVSLYIRASIIAAAETALAATAAAATTLWIPIVGWTIFGVTAAISIGWFLYKVIKISKPIKIKEPYQVKYPFIIEYISYREVCNPRGKIENQKFTFDKNFTIKGFNRLDNYEIPFGFNKFVFTCTFKKKKKDFYSTFAKIVIIVYLRDMNCDCNSLDLI